jgi:DNA modification methylase
MPQYKILSGNSLEASRQIDVPIHLIVTSPPYYRMRRYGVDFVWGGDALCEHEWVSETKKNALYRSASGQKQKTNSASIVNEVQTEMTCAKCGAWYGELGQESSPELYTSHLADVFDVCREKLTDTGVLFLNLGDTFAGGGKGMGSGKRLTNKGSGLDRNPVPNGYKQKDLLMIPHMVAAELRKRGWYLRAEIPWICPNKMPGPWKDRPIIGHEWFFMFTKSAKCSYDGVRVALAAKYAEEHARKSTSWGSDRKHPNKNNVEKYAHTGDNHTTLSGGKRLRRTSDWFTDSLGYSIEELEDYLVYLKGVRDNGEQLLPDMDGDPMALVVNNRPSSLKHFAMYNERLITPLIQSSTNEGDWVCDPFSGSGTTGRVALSMGRNYIGVEAKPEYVEISKKTLDDTLALM